MFIHREVKGLIVEAQNIYKYYGANLACEDISLSLNQGQVFGLLGPNGAGKSTLVKVLLGLVRASAGTAMINGYRASDTRGRQHAGYLPELFRHYEWLTGYEWLRFNARVYGIPAREEQGAIRRALELIGLKGREQDRIQGYSKGMQQRLALGAAILHRPALVFLDEPTSALDPMGRIEVRDIIGQLKAEGTTIFLNSHLLSEVEMTCTHLGFIRKGRLIASGAREDFMKTCTALRLETGPLAQDLLNYYENQDMVVERDEAGITLRVADREGSARIIREIVECGVPVYQAETLSLGLEEVFLDMMRD
ncbi:MAG: ABC transporter ATP-binding protein [Syntrophomonadaceae bacterium]|nr:ABC transporter ATP-binding protein [Syntrophomonadaceae bacterium]